MPNRFQILKTFVAVTVAFGMSAALNRSHAADGAVQSWMSQKQQQLTEALQSKAPVAFKAVGSRIVPVFINAVPRLNFASSAANSIITR
jgi:hypothetical protein